MTSGLSALDYEINLHPAFEDWVPVDHAFYRQFVRPWDRRWPALSPNDVAKQVAARSNRFMVELKNEIDGYSLPTCTYIPETGVVFTGHCFRSRSNVKVATARILADAYQSVASYLYAALVE